MTKQEAPQLVPVGTVEVRHIRGPERRYNITNGTLDNLATGTYPLFASKSPEPVEARPSLAIEYCWSLSEDESFTGRHDSVDDALEEAQDDLRGNHEPGDMVAVFVGEVTPALSYLSAEWVGEWVTERLDEYLAENHIAADDQILEIDGAGKEALGRIIIDWLASHAKTWRYGVENIKQHDVIVGDAPEGA